MMEKILAQKPDSLIKQEGMNILLSTMGKVEAEQFISLIIREPFDYTQWQETLFEEMSLEELSKKAMKYYEEKKNKQ